MFDAFIKIDGIQGESTDHKHKEWIEVLSFSWGVNQTGSFSHGSGGGTGKVSFNDFNFVKRLDKATPQLFVSCCSGEHIKDVTLAVRDSKGSSVDYLKIKLTDVLISSVRPGGTSQGADTSPLEEVSLNFSNTAHIEFFDQQGRGTGATVGSCSPTPTQVEGLK
jgi:type VI secretion system secreted protein Hcp